MAAPLSVWAAVVEYLGTENLKMNQPGGFDCRIFGGPNMALCLKDHRQSVEEFSLGRLGAHGTVYASSRIVEFLVDECAVPGLTVVLAVLGARTGAVR